MVATMPEYLAFKNDHGKTFFRAQGALLTVLGELTQSREKASSREQMVTRAA